MDKYLTLNIVECHQCKKKFNKSLGVINRGRWYCTTDCADEACPNTDQQKIEFYTKSEGDDDYNDELGSDFEL